MMKDCKNENMHNILHQLKNKRGLEDVVSNIPAEMHDRKHARKEVIEQQKQQPCFPTLFHIIFFYNFIS